jgi:hypothetical protein
MPQGRGGRNLFEEGPRQRIVHGPCGGEEGRSRWKEQTFKASQTGEARGPVCGWQNMGNGAGKVFHLVLPQLLPQWPLSDSAGEVWVPPPIIAPKLEANRANPSYALYPASMLKRS